jgi:hypothetical protein
MNRHQPSPLPMPSESSTLWRQIGHFGRVAVTHPGRSVKTLDRGISSRVADMKSPKYLTTDYADSTDAEFWSAVFIRAIREIRG